MNVQSVVAVALGGAVGSVLRYVVGFAFVQRFGPGFPWGTFFINVTGSFVIGVIAEITATRSLALGPAMRLLLTTGLIGGYTTFSTFSLDALNLINDGAPSFAAVYAIGTVVLGVAAALLGVILVRALTANA